MICYQLSTLLNVFNTRASLSQTIQLIYHYREQKTITVATWPSVKGQILRPRAWMLRKGILRHHSHYWVRSIWDQSKSKAIWMWTLKCELRSIQDRSKWVWTLSQSELRSIQLRSILGAIHTSELDRSEIDLSPKRSECERSNANWDRSQIDPT